MSASQHCHIAALGSAAGNIRIAFPDDDVLVFADDLSFGPLYPIADATAFSARLSWLENLWQIVCAPECSDIILRRQLTTLLLSRLHRCKGVTIWVGNNSREQLMLSALLEQLQQSEVFIINVTTIGGVSSVANVPPEKLALWWQERTRLSATEIEHSQSVWHQLLASPSELRIFRQGQLLAQPVSYYDHLILTALTTTPTQASHIAGEVLCMAECDTLSYLFIDYRLRTLIFRQDVLVEGPISHLRQMKIRKAI